MVVVGILRAPKQTKESVRHDVIYCVGLGHMFLLCGALWLWTICFYCVALGHMFLLCGVRPYVSIVWRWAICFYCVAFGHMFLLCGAWAYVFIGDCYESKPYVFIGLPHPSPSQGRNLLAL